MFDSMSRFSGEAGLDKRPHFNFFEELFSRGVKNKKKQKFMFSTSHTFLVWDV